MEDAVLPIAGIKHTFLDWPSPDEDAVVLFVAGCGHGCDGCQSPDLQDPACGRPYEVDEDLCRFILSYCSRNRTKNLVLSGGDPLFHHEEVQRMIDLLRRMEPGLRICVYTGYGYEEASRLVHGVDFLKVGRFDAGSRQTPGKTDLEMTLASRNQQFYDSSGRCLTKDGVLRFRRRPRTAK